MRESRYSKEALNKKGLLILVNFKDREMVNRENTKTIYEQLMNGLNDPYGENYGSVREYFLAQSYGLFDYYFDVVGPVTVSKNMSYYGQNDATGNDLHPEEMIEEACKLVDNQVNFADYDLDGDGEVEGITVIYAGYGENSGASSNTIWAHEWQLNKSGKTLSLDGVTINTYATGPELSGSSGSILEGIGTICHEYSHCLGLPDFYNMSYNDSNYGMNAWSVMDLGAYNGNGYHPAGYTAYERWYCGWLEPIELNESKNINGMLNIEDNPIAYVVYNENRSKDMYGEYYLLANHQQVGWDQRAAGHGMMILHVNYDEEAWQSNVVNDSYSPRMALIPADNNSNKNYSTAGDLWPGTSANTSLTDTTKPASILYTENTDGKKYMHKPITEIWEKDGLINFIFNNKNSNPGSDVTLIADNKTREYGEDNPLLTYTTQGTTLNGEPTLTCSATKTSPVGTYPIVVSKGGVTNTDVTLVNGTLTVTKAQLIVSVNSYSRYAGDNNPTFKITYSGFKNGETEAVLTKKPTVTCSATSNSPVGSYTITVSGGEAANYNLSYVNGTLTVKEAPMDIFEVDGMTFQLASQVAEKGVAFVKGPEAEDFTLPETTTYNGITCPVTVIADEAFANCQKLKSVKIPASINQKVGKNVFANCSRLAVITWASPLKLTNEMTGVITNPNLLLYITDSSNAPDGITNVVNNQTKRAERIVLSDKDDADFYCPTEFIADEITYTHTFNQRTQTGACRGWETMVLPFDVTEISHEEKSIITPFGALDRGYEYVKNTKPFWLYKYSSKGFVEAEQIEANVPYIISMPNEARLGLEYILKGSVTFKGNDVTVKETSKANVVKNGRCSFIPNYQNNNQETAYVLNVGKGYDAYPEGSVFVKINLLGRNAHPFEAYFELEGSAGVKPYFGVFEHMTDEIRSIEPATRKGNVEYYQLDGIKRSKLQRGFNIIRTPDGKTQKVAIK